MGIFGSLSIGRASVEKFDSTVQFRESDESWASKAEVFLHVNARVCTGRLVGLYRVYDWM